MGSAKTNRRTLDLNEALLKPGVSGAISLFIFALVTDLAGQLLRGPPADPDVLMPVTVVFGAFLIFAFWASSVAAWGCVLSAWLRVERAAVTVVALGTLGASASAMVLGYLGLLGARCAPLFTLLLLLGHGLNVGFHATGPAGRRARRPDLRPSMSWVASGGVGLLVLYAVGRGFLPHGMSDPLRYHATGPRLWWDAGRIFFPTSLPLLYLCSYWEYLALWGNALLAGPGGGGLIEGQLFTQWTHAVFGFGGAALALRALLGRFEVDSKWAWAATLAALSTPQLYPAAWLGNNDWGVIFWTLAGAAFLFERRAVLGGACLGFATAGKFTAAFAAAAVLAVWWAAAGPRAPERRERNRDLARAAAALIVAALPILARNAAATGNPFYPALESLFPSAWLGPTWAAHQRLYEVSGLALAPAGWGVKLVDLFNALPLWLGATVLVLPFMKTSARRLAPLWALAALSYVLFGLNVREGNDYLRLAGAALCLFPAAGVLTLAGLRERVFARGARGARAARLRSRVEGAACVALCLLLVWRSSASFQLLGELAEMPSPTLVIREVHLGGDAMAWLRLNAAPFDTIATTGANQIYYLSPLVVAVIPEQPALDRQTIYQSPRQILRVLRQYGYRYLLDGRHWGGFYWSTLAERLATLTSAHPGSFAYVGKGGDVIDLARLEAAVLPECEGRVEF